MAESEETGLDCQVSQGESDDDSSFEVIEDPRNPRVSTGWSNNVESNHAAFCFRCVHFTPPRPSEISEKIGAHRRSHF